MSPLGLSRCLTPGQVLLGGALLGDGLKAVADLGRIGADVVETWELGEALEAEHALEERRRAVADGSAGGVVARRLGDEAALQEVRDGRVGGDAADPRDVRPRAGPEVRDDRKRL